LAEATSRNYVSNDQLAQLETLPWCRVYQVGQGNKFMM
jgi:hypothetical protein